jgi:plastocyanin
VTTVLALALVPAAASAAQHTFTLRYGPVELGGFQTRYPEPRIRSPKVAGYIVRMSARIVDRHGTRVPLSHVMLHHVVFFNDGHPGGPKKHSTCPGRDGEPFYGTGEEHQTMLLPPGYGYRVQANDRWRMMTMLMSHRLAPTRVWVEYRVTIETSKQLEAVRPLWLRADGCDPRSAYTVTGGGAPGSVDEHSTEWKMPISGHIVAAGAHLHGSSKNLLVSQPRCGDRTLIDQRPRWGNPDDPVYQVRPQLHEPGPIATGYFLSRQGIPIRRGEMLKVTGRYDDSLPHPAVMAITHIYVARDDSVTTACAPLPADAHIHWSRKLGRETVPPAQVPLNDLDATGHVQQIARAAGPTTVAGDTASVDLKNSLFGPSNLSIALGGTVTWHFDDPIRHVVILANGPRAVDSPLLKNGKTYSQQFTVPGTYNLFCYLHPMTMHETLVVRPGAAAPAPAPSPAS